MISLLSIWWVWISAAIVLAILEMLAPGYIFLGFAIGAAGLGVLLVGPAALLPTPVLILIFAGLSLLAWWGLRKLFPKSTGDVRYFDNDIND